MYQLSHLLTEQKTLLNALYNTSILGDDSLIVIESDSKKNKEEKDEEIRRQKLTTILEKVEGCIDLLEVPNRMLLHEGHITELDSSDYTPLASVWAFLFSDGLMLAKSNSNMCVTILITILILNEQTHFTGIAGISTKVFMN